MDTISIIGCGKLGKCLGRVWTQRHLLQIEAVLTRTMVSAKLAVDFLGQGRGTTKIQELGSSSFVMIAVPDDAISRCCAQLAESEAIKPGTIVFHCSGSLPSSVLETARKKGALIASVHPLRSFADPARCAETFAGTPCGIEGDSEAAARLTRLMIDCGAKTFQLQPESKLFYHSGTVMMCNYLTALIEAGLQCYELAGISRDQALELVKPILSETLENNFEMSPAAALTGPIARGDAELVSKQVKALMEKKPALGNLYKAAGLVALELSRQKGAASPESLTRIEKTLGK